jgi:hypothetical protein
MRKEMTPRKRWPNEAEYAREESIAAARTGLRTARELARMPGNETALRGLIAVTDAFHTIIENLLTVGPKNEPPMLAT